MTGRMSVESVVGSPWSTHIGLALEPSGLVAIDADTYKPECEWEEFARDHSMPTTRSASGGPMDPITICDEATVPST